MCCVNIYLELCSLPDILLLIKIFFLAGFPDDDQQTDSDDSDIEVVLQEAEKQFLIDTPPKVLTLHLKRFDQFGTRVVKNNRQVSFDTILDLAPFCTKNCQVRLILLVQSHINHVLSLSMSVSINHIL